jgi:folate-dependent phosphoribosylglycinamide formyltransferase PurN
MSKPRLLIVTNGNYFARLIIEPTLLDSRWEVSGIVIVSGDYYGRAKWRAFVHLARKMAFPYLTYKVLSTLLFEVMDLVHKGKFTVASFAKLLGVPVLVSYQVNDTGVIKWVSNLRPDVLVSVSCPQRINKPLLSIPKVAAINIHGSLLPSYSGLAPYFWVLAKGEKQTGITVHYMTEKFDEGNILSQATLDIMPKESAFSLFKRLSYTGATVLSQGIERALKGDPGIPQDPRRRSYFSHPTWEAYIQMKQNNHSLITIQDLIELLTSNRRAGFTERK